MAINWNTAIRYGQLAQLAYDAGTNADPAKVKALLAPFNYDLVTIFYGNDLATDINQGMPRDPVSFGFLALSTATKELVVSIRGTTTFLEWIQDARFGTINCPIPGTKGQTEDGFTDLYESLRTGPDPGSPRIIAAIKAQLDSGAATSVSICGHSLGGALTTPTGIDVALNTSCKDPLVYSYASPFVGDSTFAQQYDSLVKRTFRVANRFDVVPRLPPIGYEHVHTLFELVPPFFPFQVKLTLLCMHSLTTYLWLMAKAAGVGGFPLEADCQA
jgi:hypothetical protein